MNRRESLAAVAGVAATLSGCTGFGSSASDPSSSPTASERGTSRRPGSGSLSDPEQLRLRVAGSGPPLRLADENPDADTERGPAAERRRLESTVIDTQSRAARLSVADGIDSERLDTFVSATDFASETLYLESAQVGECFTLALCRIAWQPDMVSTEYARQTRPYDERCAVDQQVVEARLIRLPDPLDAESVHRFSRSIGTDTCGRDRAVGESGSGSGPRTPVGTDTSGGTDTQPTARTGEQ